MATIGINTTLYLANPPEGEIRYGMDEAPSRQWEMIAMGVSTTAVAVLVVGLRLFTRISIIRSRVNIDDYLVVAGLLCSIATVAASIKQTDYGLSFHKWDILFTTFNIWYPVYNIVGTGTYALSIMFSKLSILFFYLRLSPQTWFRWCTYALISASIVYSLVYVFLNIFPCQPIEAIWDFSIENSTCLDPWMAYWALSILNIIMDVCTLVLPIPVVVPLQMEKKQKLSLLLLFATGAFVCAIAIRRTTLIPILFASHDRPWDAVDDYLLSYAEMNVGIVCATVPAIKPLFVRCLSGRTKSRSGIGRGPYSRGQYTSNNTVIEQNRSRRKMQNESFQLSSIDEPKHSRNYSYDDEGVHLWHAPSRDDGYEKAMVVGSKPIMGITSPSLEELRGDRAVYGARAMASSPKPRLKSGITVTRETVIQYERER